MQTASRDISVRDRERLRGHVVNIRQGRFSSDGDFITTLQDVQAIFSTALATELADARAANRKLRLLFYAHGGLVNEASGLAGALSQIDFWKANNVYPIFFIWETGLLEALADILRKQLAGQRGLTGFVKEATAKLLESLARSGGVRVWGNMKLSAQAASATGGAACVVAELAANFVKANLADVEVHAIGHSAGSIFHAFFLPVLVKADVPVASLNLLAPAVNIPTFKANLAPLSGKGIGPMTMLTMHREFERADTAGPYPQSLLYFVHHSFEDPDETPILGLEESFTADTDVVKLFMGANEIVFSVTSPTASKRSSSRAIHHGDFDNDAATMNSVCRRILDVSDSVAISDFPEVRGRAFDPLEQLNQELLAATVAGDPFEDMEAAKARGVGFGAANAMGGKAGTATEQPGPAMGASRGRRIALCVGIDAYPAPNTLAGCVNDSHDWEALFRSMGFSVGALRDEAATREAIMEGLASHVSRLRAGDVFLFQYSGHGTQFADEAGDEPDGKDEAFCPVEMMTAGFIRDDDIRKILNAVPVGALAIGFIDCCHSGTIARLVRLDAGARGVSDSRIRAIEPTPEMIEVHRRTRTRGRAAVSGTRRDITFAACRDDQVAFETAGHGDYTKAVVPIVKARINRLSNLALQNLIQRAFGTGARQNPMLDCDPGAENRIFLEP